MTPRLSNGFYYVYSKRQHEHSVIALKPIQGKAIEYQAVLVDLHSAWMNRLSVSTSETHAGTSNSTLRPQAIQCLQCTSASPADRCTRAATVV